MSELKSSLKLSVSVKKYMRVNKILLANLHQNRKKHFYILCKKLQNYM